MDSVHHVLIEDVAVCGISGIAAGDVPVHVDIALFRGLPGQVGHDAFAVIGAHRIGAAAGEAEEVCPAAGLLPDDILHAVEVFPVRVCACVDLAVLVRGGVDSYAVSRLIFLADKILVVAVSGCDEEGGQDLVLIQNAEQFLGVSAGAVVKSQIDDLLGIRLQRCCGCGDSGIAGGSGGIGGSGAGSRGGSFSGRRGDHSLCGRLIRGDGGSLYSDISVLGRHISPFVRDAVSERIGADRAGVNTACISDPPGDVSVGVIFRLRVVRPGLAHKQEALLSGREGEDGSIAVIIEDLSFSSGCISSLVRYGVVDLAVALFTLDKRSNIAVMIVCRRETFFHVGMMGQRIIIVYMRKFDNGGRCIDDNHASGRRGAHPQELGRIGDGISAGLVDVDSLRRSRYGDRVVDEAEH